MFRKLLPVLLILALGLTACGFHVSLPITTITPGPTVTDQINVPLPADASKTVDLSLAFGAGTLKSSPAPIRWFLEPPPITSPTSNPQ